MKSLLCLFLLIISKINAQMYSTTESPKKAPVWFYIGFLILGFAMLFAFMALAVYQFRRQRGRRAAAEDVLQMQYNLQPSFSPNQPVNFPTNQPMGAYNPHGMGWNQQIQVGGHIYQSSSQVALNPTTPGQSVNYATQPSQPPQYTIN